MSNFNVMTRHLLSGKVGTAIWIDDYFGPHQYGVWFPDGTIYPAATCEVIDHMTVPFTPKKWLLDEARKMSQKDSDRYDDVRLRLDELERAMDLQNGPDMMRSEHWRKKCPDIQARLRDEVYRVRPKHEKATHPEVD